MAHARPNHAAFEILIHLHILRRTKFEQAAPSENVTVCKSCGPEASSSIIISQYPDTGQFVLGDNLPPMYANADTLTSCNPQQKDDSHQELGLGMIIRNLTPISDKDEPTKQAKTTSSKSCML